MTDSSPVCHDGVLVAQEVYFVTPHAPDLASYDFWLFPKIEARFATSAERRF
jgi:hypothetical protein